MQTAAPRGTQVTGPLERFLAVRTLTDELTAPLGPEDQQVQSMPDVSPTKWHRAHTTWFFETFLLQPHCPGYEAFDPAFGYLFNSYYEAVGDRHPRPQRGLVTRPDCAAVTAYRAHVDAAMARWIDSGDADGHAALVELGCHHEQQHQELLLMDITHVFSVNPTAPAYLPAADAPARTNASASPPSWIGYDGGLVDVGAEPPGAGDPFVYDNETPRHRQWVEPFRLADRLVTCGEWQEFVADGGYRRPELWLSDGWATVQREGWTAPLYWRTGADGEPVVFTLTGERPLDPATPVSHVSHYEADAYARWAGARLPTETEWEVAATTAVAAGVDVDAGTLTARRTDLHPRPAGDDVPPGVPRQLFGDVWEWTSSQYSPYPRFRPAPGAVGEYNGKFMVDQHVLRGGCALTPPGHVRATYRNFFPSSARWVMGGLRLASDV